MSEVYVHQNEQETTTKSSLLTFLHHKQLKWSKMSVSFAHYCEQRKSKRCLLPTAALSHVAAAVVIPCTRWCRSPVSGSTSLDFTISPAPRKPTPDGIAALTRLESHAFCFQCIVFSIFMCWFLHKRLERYVCAVMCTTIQVQETVCER